VSKVYYFITITLALTVLLNLARNHFIRADELLNWAGIKPDNLTVSTSYLVIAITGMFLIGAATGSIFSKESSLRATISTGILLTGIGAFMGILNYVNGIATGTEEWVYWIIFMLFVVWISGFIFAMIEFWGGTG
jgi:hypothetical protein